ncbi:unnamed protein product [Symbiodinium natans]|uniref:Uncharacterized protein n=1 Tax=Symbiodinium natans TaxID=878477 RepID=A0A812RMR9_9DINO|nr:unnamed protein product [Symbiodinium natans]
MKLVPEALQYRDGDEDATPRGLALLLEAPEALALGSAAAASPLELVAAVSSSPLRFAAEAAESTSSEVLLSSPCLWLHQQFAEELAIACSEYSAAALLVNPPQEEPRCGGFRSSQFNSFCSYMASEGST